MAGGGIANKAASVVSEALVGTHQQLTGHKRSLGALVLEDFFDKVSGEIRHTMGGLFAKLSDHPDLPAEYKPVFDFLGKGNGQWQTFLGQAVAGSALSTGLGLLMSNDLAVPIGTIVAVSPNLPLSVSDAAGLAARELGGPLDLAYEAAKQGIDGVKFNRLVELGRPRMAPAELLDLANRGIIGSTETSERLTMLGYRDDDIQLWKHLAQTELSPQELASLVTFGVLDEGEATPIAARSGMSGEDFHRLVLGNGQPPSTQDLLFAYRRGIIDRARLLRGIQQGPVRNEWFDVLESLGTIPMSTADAVEAAVQGHLSTDAAATIARQNGLRTEDFQPLYDTAGSPLGVQEMLTLKNRGIMTEAEVIQGIRESRLKNKYIPYALAGSVTLPPQDTIKSMLSKGAITEAKATDLLLQHGFDPEIVAAFVNEAHATKTQKTRDLSESQIAILYQDHAIDQTTAAGMLQNLGYDPDEAAYLLAIVDLQRAQKYINAAITRVRSSFVSNHIDDVTASSTLDSIGVPGQQRDDLIALWKIEQGTISRALTEPQIIQAVKKNLMDPDTAYSRLTGMGYSGGDAAILINIAGFQLSSQQAGGTA